MNNTGANKRVKISNSITLVATDVVWQMEIQPLWA